VYIYNDEDNVPMNDYPWDSLPFSELYNLEEQEEEDDDTMPADSKAH